MIPYLSQSPGSRQMAAPLVLIAEDDARVLELMTLAFANERFRVVTAVDGDEAIRRALAERPDLVVLDVQMPRKNGFEVCEWLRHDAEDPSVPIVFVSASGETEVRIEGLSRGADDFLSKPFSPRELVARCRRLLARSGAARAERQRATSLEREVDRVQEEARRAHRDLQQERRLRELALAAGRELHATLDPDVLAERVLVAAQSLLGARTVALLAPAGDTTYTPRATRGERPDAFAGLSLPAGGELATLLGAIGRPLAAHELERGSNGRRAECGPLACAGVALVAPLRGTQGLEAVLLADDRADGTSWGAADRDALGLLCEMAANAVRNATRFRESQERSLELAAEHAHATPRARAAAAEAGRFAERAAEALALPERERTLLRHAVAFGPWTWGEPGRLELAGLEQRDPTDRVRELRELCDRAESLDVDAAPTPAARRAALVAGVCVRYQVGRGGGRSVLESWRTALSWVGPALDPPVAAALAGCLEDRRPVHARAA